MNCPYVVNTLTPLKTPNNNNWFRTEIPQESPNRPMQG